MIANYLRCWNWWFCFVLQRAVALSRTVIFVMEVMGMKDGCIFGSIVLFV